MAVRSTLIKKAFGGTGKITNVAIPALGAVSTFNQSRESGNGVIESTARAGFDYAVGEALGWKNAIALMAAPPLASAAVSAYQATDRMSRQLQMQNTNTPFMYSHFGDTQKAYTMRQHGMQLAKNSRYHLEQSLMGSEAQHFKY